MVQNLESLNDTRLSANVMVKTQRNYFPNKMKTRRLYKNVPAVLKLLQKKFDYQLVQNFE